MEGDYGASGRGCAGDMKYVKKYQEQVLERVEKAWKDEGDIKEKWISVHSALIETADRWPSQRNKV